LKLFIRLEKNLQLLIYRGVNIMLNKISKPFEKLVGRLTCGEDDTCSKATAFLVAPNRAITARHAIEDYYSAGKQLKLEFLNIEQAPVLRKAIPVNVPELDGSPISILELDRLINCDYYLSFYDYEVKKDDSYETFGYPVVKWAMGEWTKSNVSRRVTKEMAQPFDWDIDLNHNSNIEDFRGLSGSPLFVNTKLVGVVLTESTANHKAISLGSISIQSMRETLLKAEIPIETPLPTYIMEEIYEIDESNNFSESLFIAKLESAEIFDHEDCQQEFFNAEIAKSSIESRNIPTELKSFTMLKHNIQGIWKTQHRSYKNERDGNELLTLVYERVEDLSDTTLKGDGNLSLTAKKGILHQLSDECKVGWVRNYQLRLKEHLLEKGEKND
jgi:hypothetical protein